MPDRLRNLRLDVEYDGTAYCGWQVQNKNHRARSIQEVIEEALQRVLHERVKIIGSGRTDAGVHARQQVANFHTRHSIPAENLLRALNAVLPPDICVTRVRQVRGDFHSRYDAVSKTYRYTILNRPCRSASHRLTSWHCPYPLDMRLMRAEAASLAGRHDFTSFRTSGPSRTTDAVRTIRKIKIARENDFIYIDIQADGFLYNMARSIVGTVLDCGRGRLAGGSLKKILRARDRRSAGPTAPACGLCLLKVQY